MFRNPFSSIGAQVQVLAALSAATALTVACAAFVLNDVRVASSAKQQQLYRYAAVVARNVGHSVSRGDWEEAQTQLAAFRLEPTVTAAALYDAGGQVVATYRRDEQGADPFPAYTETPWSRHVEGDELAIFQPIHRREERVGSLYVQSTTDDLRQQRAAYTPIVGVVFLISLGVAAAFAARMHKRISNPLTALADAARRVTAEGDYTVRVEVVAGGQLAALSDAFNAMLERVEAADRKLQDAHDKLNARSASGQENCTARCSNAAMPSPSPRGSHACCGCSRGALR